MLQADKAPGMSRISSSKDAPMSRTSPTQLLNGAERPSLAPALQSMQDPALPALKLTLLSILFLSKMEAGAVGAPSKAVTKGSSLGWSPGCVLTQPQCGILFPGWNCSSRKGTCSKIWSPKTRTLSASFLEPHSAPPKHTNNQQNRPHFSLILIPTDALQLLQLLSMDLHVLPMQLCMPSCTRRAQQTP